MNNTTGKKQMTNKTENKLNSNEKAITINEASQLLSFFNSWDYPKIEFYTTGDLLKRGILNYFDSSEEILGNDPVLVYNNSKEKYLEVVKPVWDDDNGIELKKGISDILGNEITRDCQGRFYPGPHISKDLFWPFYLRFGEGLFKESLSEKVKSDKSLSAKLRYFKEGSDPMQNVNPEDVVSMFNSFYGTEVGKIVEDKISNSEDSIIYPSILDSDISTKGIFSGKQVPVSLNITGKNSSYLEARAPKEDLLLFNHPMNDSILYRNLIEYVVKPTEVGGLLTMQKDKIPDFLRRSLGLYGESKVKGGDD